jgi:hypothetical protein
MGGASLAYRITGSLSDGAIMPPALIGYVGGEGLGGHIGTTVFDLTVEGWGYIIDILLGTYEY